VSFFGKLLASCREKTLAEWGWLAFVLSVAAAGCSMPVARGFLVLAAVAMIIGTVRARVRIEMPAVAWLALFYVLWLAAVTVFGLNPSRGIPRLPKLLWFLFIPVAAYYVHSLDRLRRTVEAYVLGVAVLSVQTCIRNPLRAMESVSSGEAATFLEGLITNGSITNGERLMVGMIASIGLVWPSGSGGGCGRGCCRVP
jgi:putative effector of murein hydrolase LrgA (UPF0299 family)